MAYLIALGILSLVSVLATVWLIRTDGYARIPVDESRRVIPEPPAVGPDPAPTRTEAAPRGRSVAPRAARSTP